MQQLSKLLTHPGVSGGKPQLRQRLLGKFGLQQPAPVPARLLYMLSVHHHPPPAPRDRKRKSGHSSWGQQECQCEACMCEDNIWGDYPAILING